MYNPFFDLCIASFWPTPPLAPWDEFRWNSMFACEDLPQAVTLAKALNPCWARCAFKPFSKSPSPSYHTFLASFPRMQFGQEHLVLEFFLSLKLFGNSQNISISVPRIIAPLPSSSSSSRFQYIQYFRDSSQALNCKIIYHYIFIFFIIYLIK